MADGREVSVTYDTSARVDRVVADGREYDYVYGEDAYLATVSGGVADVAFEWDGPLLTRQASSGVVSGDITWTWEDGTLSLSTMNINGHDVDFTFDKDAPRSCVSAKSPMCASRMPTTTLASSMI